MPTHYNGKPAEIQALDSFIKLKRAANSLLARESATLRGQGLTPTQFGLLETLYHLGPLGPKQLGEKLLTSGANITTVLDNLEKNGLVRRQAVPGDRRCLRIQLSARGKKKIAAAFSVHVKDLAHSLGHLSPAEQKELSRLCKKLGLAVQKENHHANA
jgi:MarR family 2-MHQ and catechol resistance regulon transcriptional repressor